MTQVVEPKTEYKPDLIPERPGSMKLIPARLRVPYHVKSRADTIPGCLKTFRSKPRKDKP